jgi:predicted ferric reductase
MELQQAIMEIQQPRSRFMLEKMTLGEHDTPEMRFYYCVVELNDKLHKFRLAEISKERMEREMKRLSESDEQDADLDLLEKRAEYDFFMGVMAGAERE